jgi:8-oxo-dGTP diphosphatase
MRETTLCFIVNSDKVLLGMKKRGFGMGKYTGFGGKKSEGERIEEAAIRELREETGIVTNLDKIEKIAKLYFTFPYKKEWNQVVHTYLVKEWEGEPNESEEMRPEWFNINNLPSNEMWSDSKYWLPLILRGEKIEAYVQFKEDNETVDSYKIKELND